MTLPSHTHADTSRRVQLETDHALLIPKSRAALERYGHQVVIGNTLHERKHEVVFVDRRGESWVRLDERERETIGRDGEVREIEQDIVAKLEGMHERWIVEGAGAGGGAGAEARAGADGSIEAASK